jgi:hypothetical protein
MKRFTVVLFAAALSLAFLSSPAILEAGGGHGGVGSGWAGGGHSGGHYGGPVGGHWGGYHGGYYGGHYGWHGGYYGGGYYPYWGYYPFYWGAWAVGWPYGGWPYGYYAASPYQGWPYYPSGVTEASPAYSEPAPQQPYYWYYCQDPQGYYPYVRSCPGGWIQVVPNVTPPNQ